MIEIVNRPREALKIAQRDREGPRLCGSVLSSQSWEVVLVRPLLDDHVPVGHLDRCNRELGLPLNRRGPVESDREVLRREERGIPLVPAVNHQIIDDESPGEEMNGEPPDVDRPFDGFGPG